MLAFFHPSSCHLNVQKQFCGAFFVILNANLLINLLCLKKVVNYSKNISFAKNFLLLKFQKKKIRTFKKN